MKKTALILVLMFIFTGCTVKYTPTKQDIEFFKKIPNQYIYSANAGGWGTQLIIADNGTFSGKYFDIDKNNKGEKNPDGTAYICNFSGELGNVEKIDEYTYTMEVKRLDVEKAQGEEYIEGGIKYISAKPYGMENADLLKVYFPGKPTSKLKDEYFMWDKKSKDSKKLLHYSIYNEKDNVVFVQMKE